MAGVWWEMARDLVVVCALLVGYVWLSVLTLRVQALSRRLAVHVCRKRDGPEPERRLVHANEILRREQNTPRPMLPATPVRPAERDDQQEGSGMERDADAARLRGAMVERMVRNRGLPPVWEEVVRAVPRHVFVPEVLWYETEQGFVPLCRADDVEEWLAWCTGTAG
jgi:hypothetical protein